MELFSVACITCRAKIQVRSVSAIGQVLACPRCGGMVEITAPPGWKPPPVAKALPKAKAPAAPAQAPAQPAAPTSAAKPPESTVDADAAHPKPRSQPPSQPQADPPATATDAPVSYVAEPVADDDPLAALERQAADRSRAQRKVFVIGVVAVAGLALIGVVIRHAVSGPEEIGKAPPSDPPAATATPTKPPPLPTSATGAAIPIATSPLRTGTPSATPSATASGTAPAPTPTATPTATLAATAAPTGSGPLGSGPLGSGPLGTALARIEPPPAKPPVALAPPVRPAQVFLPPWPEAEKRLASKAPTLELAGLSRREAVALVGRLAGAGVQYDWDVVAPAELKLDEPVTLKAGDATYTALLARLLEPIGARCDLFGSNLMVRPAEAAPTSVDYPIDDLAGGDAAAAELYAGLVQLFVAPDTWESQGGTGKLTAAAGKLSAVQSPAVQRELLVWLDRLRTARGKSTKGSPQSNDSRFVRAKGALEKPITMNFRPGVPLGEIVAFLNKKSDVTISIDFIALAAAGNTLDEPIGIAVDKTPLAEVLAAICEPRELDYRIVDERTIEITTREALRRRGYVEFYDLRPLIAAEISPVELIKRIKADFADAGWVETGGEGVARFDAASNRLILRHHQDAHRHIERFLGELTAEIARMKAGVPATPTPAATAAPSASPSATPAATRPVGPIVLPATRPGSRLGTPQPTGPQPSGSRPSGLQPSALQPNRIP